MNFHDPNSLQHIFAQVIRLYHQRTQGLLDKVGVYPGQPFLLFALVHMNGQSQKDLAEKLNIKASTIATMVKRMEKVGLIERRQDPVDQRVSRVYITEEGKKVCEEVMKIKETISQETFCNFTEEEQLLLRRLLMQVHENLKNACRNT
ncbi:MarR family winged helix-turn-helix transcriptional regulator [Alkaliphilus oremlandii]|uniref:Transcriptional regulator, MarR family n=1 Tax=Alkaliphilus oremlandii (strain OhILAs) TaxID=350688 RepID=A8MK78_ALKOO|nr:MarR family transcriptional regulator [Alkaliphilus oremlandii]ABW20210.1 transcriptional regulator, MarR family [Alkaliphilus oremlandii OhILAs]